MSKIEGRRAFASSKSKIYEKDEPTLKKVVNRGHDTGTVIQVSSSGGVVSRGHVNYVTDLKKVPVAKNE